MNNFTVAKNTFMAASATAMLACTTPKITANAITVVLPDAAPKVEQLLITSPVAQALRDTALYEIPAGAVTGGLVGFLSSIGTQVKNKKTILKHTLEGTKTGAELAAVTGPLLATVVHGVAGAAAIAFQNVTALTTIIGSKRMDEQTLRIAQELIEQNKAKAGKVFKK